MVCENCRNEMRLDDKDVNFKGNLDKYWVCETCGMSCVEKIRGHKSVNVIWQAAED